MQRRTFLKASALGALSSITLPWLPTARAQSPSPRKTPYILGADVSWILEDEAEGATYWDRGEQKDPLLILKNYGFNYIRARIFVNPHAPGGYSARRNEAFCDLEHTAKFASRIKAAGLSFLLSIHYGDTWTSPGKQAKPAAWANLPYGKLVTTVHDWTAGVLAALQKNGTPPQMVSVGNETSDGVLFPDGRSSNFDKFAELINAGCTAVRQFNPATPVALHNHLGRDNAFNRTWVDNFLKRKTQFDIIGMSCYNEGRRGAWKDNFDDLATRYPQLGFAALEYSYEKRYLNDLIFNAPNEKGLGSFIWEPTRWREAIFDHNGQNAGDDMNNKPHLPASTLPPLNDKNQPTYHPGEAPHALDADTQPSTSSPPAQRQNTATTAPATRRARSRGGKYETNSYILAYRPMAKAYGL